MFSRSVGRFIAITFRNRKLFHQSARYMAKDGAIKSYTVSNTPINDSMTMIKSESAKNSDEFLIVLSENVDHFSAAETMGSLRTLFELQKDATTSINRKVIVRNADFERLCRSLKRNARYMELNDVIDALKIISFVGVKSNSEVTMSLLNLIKYQINDVSLGHIIFLDYLLGQMEANPLVDVLKQALPALLQVQISTKLDHENLNQLVDLLHFVSHRSASDPCIMSIVSSIKLRAADLSPKQARKVVWSLSSPTLRNPNAYLDELLLVTINVMRWQDIGKEDITTVITTIDKMVNKYLDDPYEFKTFYSETFFKYCADLVVANDLGFKNATFLQRHFNKLGFVHFDMLKYMLREVEKDATLMIECKPISFITLVSALSQASFVPKDKIKSLIGCSNVLTKEKRTNLPWPQLLLELLSLRIQCTSICDKIFTNQYLNEHLTHHRRNERLLRILELYQVLAIIDYNVEGKIDEKFIIEAKELLESTVQFPMQPYLELAFGGPTFVRTKVKTKLGHIIDHLIAFDRETKASTPLDGASGNDVFYEDIATDKSKIYIAVLPFPGHCFGINMPILKGTHELKLWTYQQMGITTFSINQQMWNEMPDEEKIIYIQTGVKFKL